MEISKTRNKIIDAARQVFAKKGVENATMNDIAVAARKGRRTLYTYFNNKEELYWAVAETELDLLSDMMEQAASKDISPDKKIIAVIYARLETVKVEVYRNGTLKADFFRDIWKVETVRKRFDIRQILLFKQILREGVEKGVFEIDDVDFTALLIHYCVKGIEVPYIRGQIGNKLEKEKRKEYVSNIVFGALHKKSFIK
ncbi:MAG: TetR/AcrR family transcriptional regulator [Bacteroidales bacterium]|nr:TetR/AcrR family transcriptional regulator [Bacteroidales bacterium]